MKKIGIILIILGLAIVAFTFFLLQSDTRFAIMTGISALSTLLTGIGFTRK